MKVKEIMTREVVNITGDMNVAEALSLLFRLKISGLPVLDAHSNLIGMFTEKDVLRYILPGYLYKVGRFVYEENPKATKKKTMDLKNLKVSQLMRRDVVTLDEEATLCEVAHTMLMQRVRRIPILGKDKKVAGIVAREDVVRAFAKEAGLS